MTEPNFTEEEQAYLDAGRGDTPEKIADEIVVDEPVVKVEEDVVEAKDDEVQGEAVEGESAEKGDVVEGGSEENGEVEQDEAAEEKPEQPQRKSANERIRALKDERKSLREQVSELKKAGSERLSRLEEEVSLQNQKTAPDRDYDPEALIDHQAERLTAYETADTQRRENSAKQAKEQSEFDDLNAFVQDHEDAFSETHEDYYDAIEWGRGERIKHYTDTYGMSAKEAEIATANEVSNAAINIRNLGGNVAHYLYQEITRMGWKGNGNGTETTESSQAGDLEAVAKGQRAAVNPKGGGSNKGLQLEDVAAMDDTEFHKRVGDMDALKKLFGA